jgi:hypothetical protein
MRIILDAGKDLTVPTTTGSPKQALCSWSVKTALRAKTMIGITTRLCASCVKMAQLVATTIGGCSESTRITCMTNIKKKMPVCSTKE